jgi:uncharacterized coiled-coil protein SlyX
MLWKQIFHCTQTAAHNLLKQEERLLQQEQKLSRLESKLAEVETDLGQTNAKVEFATTRLNRYVNLPLIEAVRRVRRMLFRLPPPPDS